MGKVLAATLSELVFDLTTKDGQALEETVVTLMQRGPAGLQALLKAVDEPKMRGRVRKAVTDASARVAEAFAAIPAKAREGTGSRLLKLIRPEVLESRGRELLGRGEEAVVRQFVRALEERGDCQEAARRLGMACALRAGQLEEALTLVGRNGTAAAHGLAATILLQGRRFADLGEELRLAALAGGGTEAREAMAALLDACPGEEPGSPLPAIVDRLVDIAGDGGLSLLKGAVEDRLRLAREEAVEGAKRIEQALWELAGVLARLETAAARASPVTWMDGTAQAGMDGALNSAMARLMEAVWPFAPAPGGGVELGEVIGQVAESAGMGGAASATPPIVIEPGPNSLVVGDERVAAALRLILAEAIGKAGRSGLTVRTEVEGVWAVVTLGAAKKGESQDSRFHPVLMAGPEAGRPTALGRDLLAARRLVRRIGGDVFWEPDDRSDGNGWVVRARFRIAGSGTSGAVQEAAPSTDADLGTLSAETLDFLNGPAPGRALGNAVISAVNRLTDAVVGRLVEVVLAEIPGIRERIEAISGFLARHGLDGGGGVEDLVRLAASTRRRIAALLTHVDQGDRRDRTHADLNEVVSTAVAEVEPVARGAGTGLVFLSATGLPRMAVDREGLMAAVSVLTEEAVRAAGRGGEVRVSLIHRSDEAIARLVIASPTATRFTPLALGLARQAAAGGGGTVILGPGRDTMLALELVVSEEERRLGLAIQGYQRLSPEARRALRTAEAVASSGTGASDPGLRPFLWLKAVELEVKARVGSGIRRHQYLPMAIDTLGAGRARLSRDGEARLACLTAALSGEETRALRNRLLSVAEAVVEDRLERVTTDLRALGVLLVAYGLPGRTAEAAARLGRALYRLGGLPVGLPSSVDACCGVFAALLELDEAK